MNELVDKNWELLERKTCCGPTAEKWGKKNSTFTIYPGLNKFVHRSQGRHIQTGILNKLNEYLEKIDPLEKKA